MMTQASSLELGSSSKFFHHAPCPGGPFFYLFIVFQFQHVKVLVRLGCHNKTRWLKQQKSHSSGGQKSSDQGTGSFGFFQGLSPWLTNGHLFAVSPHGCPSVYIPISSFQKNTINTGLQPTHMTSVYLYTNLKAQTLNAVKACKVGATGGQDFHT